MQKSSVKISNFNARYSNNMDMALAQLVPKVRFVSEEAKQGASYCFN